MVQDKGKLVHSHPANELTEKLFGIESVINKTKTADADNTTFVLSSDAVPEGKIWKITCASVLNEDGDITAQVFFYIGADITAKNFYRKLNSTAQGELVKVDVELYLEADDFISVHLYAVSIGETCVLYIFGYEMNAP